MHFRYEGSRRLVIWGAITGRVYDFDRTGATVAVDGRDAPPMLGEPSLHVLRSW